MATLHDMEAERFAREPGQVARAALAQAGLAVQELAGMNPLPLADLQEARDAISRAIEEAAAAD